MMSGVIQSSVETSRSVYNLRKNMTSMAFFFKDTNLFKNTKKFMLLSPKKTSMYSVQVWICPGSTHPQTGQGHSIVYWRTADLCKSIFYFL